MLRFFHCSKSFEFLFHFNPFHVVSVIPVKDKSNGIEISMWPDLQMNKSLAYNIVIHFQVYSLNDSSFFWYDIDGFSVDFLSYQAAKTLRSKWMRYRSHIYTFTHSSQYPERKGKHANCNLPLYFAYSTPDAAWCCTVCQLFGITLLVPLFSYTAGENLCQCQWKAPDNI